MWPEGQNQGHRPASRNSYFQQKGPQRIRVTATEDLAPSWDFRSWLPREKIEEEGELFSLSFLEHFYLEPHTLVTNATLTHGQSYSWSDSSTLNLSYTPRCSHFQALTHCWYVQPQRYTSTASSHKPPDPPRPTFLQTYHQLFGPATASFSFLSFSFNLVIAGGFCGSVSSHIFP